MILVLILTILAAIHGFVIGYVENATANWFAVACVWVLPLFKGLEVFPVFVTLTWWEVFYPLIAAITMIVIGILINFLRDVHG